jgi:hypothetical protein
MKTEVAGMISMEITESITKLITALTSAGCIHILVNKRFVVGLSTERWMGGVHNEGIYAPDPPIHVLDTTLHSRIRRLIVAGYWLLTIPVEVGVSGCGIDCSECKAANWARLDRWDYTPGRDMMTQWRMYGHELTVVMLYSTDKVPTGQWTEYAFDPATRRCINWETHTNHAGAHHKLAQRRRQGFVVEYMDCDACRTTPLSII